jgi:hypothetical protein
VFKKKKKAEPVIPNPPKVLKELRTHRYILRQVPLFRSYGNAKDGYKSEIDGYRDQLIMERKDKNAMEEPYWKVEAVLDKSDECTSHDIQHNKLVMIVREISILRTCMIADILLASLTIYLVLGIVVATIGDAIADEDAGPLTVLFWPFYIMRLLGLL